MNCNQAFEQLYKQMSTKKTQPKKDNEKERITSIKNIYYKYVIMWHYMKGILRHHYLTWKSH